MNAVCLVAFPAVLAALFSAPSLKASVLSQGNTATNASVPSDTTKSSEGWLVREEKELTLPATNLTAAYSLDSHVAEAQIVGTELHIYGRSPGSALIVLVHSDLSTASVSVTVTRAPPILPDSTWDGVPASANRPGSCSFRFNSDPRQFNESFDYRTSGFQLHFDNAVMPSPTVPGTSPVWFPSSYVRFQGVGYDVTLLDQTVNSSLISVSSTLLRGLHFRFGGLKFHAGYTSAVGFQSLFLPAQRQLIAGGEFTQKMNSAGSEIGFTSYVIRRDPAVLDPSVAQGVVTFFYQFLKPLHATDFRIESGFSNGLAGALLYNRNKDPSQFHLTVRYRPRHYAAPEIDELKGLQSDLHWDDTWGKNFISSFSGSANQVFTQSGEQTTEFATESLRFRAANGISISPAISASRFADSQSLFPSVERFAVPLAVSYDHGHFGVSGQVETSWTSRAFSMGRGYDGSLRWGSRHFQFTAGAGYQTEALGVDSAFSVFPALNVVLAQLGFSTATSAEQLAALLNDRAVLNSLGLAPGATLQLVPRNLHANLGLHWLWRRQTLELDTNYNDNFFLTEHSTTYLQTVRYRRALARHTELAGSFSLLGSDVALHRWMPIAEVGLQQGIGRNLFGMPHRAKGVISGEVTIDDAAGKHPAAAVRITLDGDRHTKTDARGFYQFTAVSVGSHSVEVQFTAARPFWYSTPSKVSALEDATVDFRIIFPLAQIIVHVNDDIGAGLPKIGVHLSGPQGERDLESDQSGKFILPVAGAGEYTATINTESVPDGYAIEQIDPLQTVLSAGESRTITFVLPAIRTLTGFVRRYDTKKGEYVPVPGAWVKIKELNLTTRTDPRGSYLFRDMPAGEFTLLVENAAPIRFELSAAPQLLRQDIRLAVQAETTGKSSDAHQ